MWSVSPLDTCTIDSLHCMAFTYHFWKCPFMVQIAMVIEVAIA